MSKEKKLTIWLWVLTICPIAVIMIAGASGEILIGYIRITDFVDLTLAAPIYLITLISIHRILFDNRTGSRWDWLSLFFIGLFIYGHAMHMTANAINTYSTEIQNYKNILPQDTYALIYFLDENLGHWILYFSLFGLLGIWLLSSEMTNHSNRGVMLSGMIFGLIYAISLIEASQPWMGALVSGWLLVCAIIWSRQRQMSLVQAWKANPLFTFVSSAAIFLLVGQAVYFLITGGFLQPSELGF